jgi:parallel beta-helix repeat protein
MPLSRFFTIAALLATALSASAAPQADFFIAPSGNDAWSGKLSAPKADRTDGPFATVQHAQRAVRALKQAQPDRKTPITVMLRGGMYPLADTLVFTPEDSGAAGAPVVYAAWPGETPVISGGVRLTGWKRTPEGFWQTQIPEVQQGKWWFIQLFVNGERRYRPRVPKEGYSYIVADASPSPEAQGKGRDRFRYREGDVRADWANLKDIELLTFHTWTMDRTQLASVDGAAHVAQRSAPTLGMDGFFALGKGTRFICENVKEALGSPGEWYLDRPTGVLTYVPKPGEDMRAVEVIAPRLDCLMRMTGEGALGLCVENITFRGLTFADGNWEMTPTGNRWGQAEVGVPGAIIATGAHGCVFQGCKVSHIGTYGIELGAGCKNCRIEDCELTDLGAGGVKIGEQGLQADENALTSNNTVSNCLIAHGGRLHPAGHGVWVGHSPYNRIANNEIADFYYSGISVGWSWGYGPSGAHHNVIENNEVHDIGQRVLSDMGGIYTLGVSPGTVIRGNRFHDVDAHDYGGWGIYLDEGSSDILIENNTVFRTRSPGFRQHYGQDNIGRNNIIALGKEAQLGRLRMEQHLSYTFEHNIVYWTEGPLLGENWSDNQYKLDDNLYWNAGKQITFLGMSFADWQKRGQDAHSLIADPLFVDPAKGDFTLKPGSPAEQIGFVPIDTSKIGRMSATGKPLPLTPVALPRAFPFPLPPPPVPIDADFEDQAVGEKAAGAVTSEENDQATIRVTDEVASSGKHSLKFIDKPGQQHEYNPHMYYQPNFTAGVIEERVDLRIEPNTHMYHEWRDYAIAPFKVGPSLWIMADGSFLANGTKLFQVPWSQWMHIEITCGVGPQNTGTYDLSVKLPGEDKPRVWKRVAFDPQFSKLDWFGFTANANADGLFYMDALHLGPRK